MSNLQVMGQPVVKKGDTLSLTLIGVPGTVGFVVDSCTQSADLIGNLTSNGHAAVIPFHAIAIMEIRS